MKYQNRTYPFNKCDVKTNEANTLSKAIVLSY